MDCFVRAIGGEKRNVRVQGPFGEEIESFYGVVKGDTAVVEMAAAAGLPLACGKRDPGKASTYGVGQLIAHAVRSGCRSMDKNRCSTDTYSSPMAFASSSALTRTLFRSLLT